MTTQRPYRILFCGGGSAGHVVPVLAVATALREELQKRHESAEFLFIGRRKSSEEALIRRANIPYTIISAGKLRRYVDFQNLVDPFRVVAGFFQAMWIIGTFHPDVIFAKGGYVSVPVLAAAFLFRIPVVAHETDSILGFSNRLATKLARVICTGYPIECYQGIRTRGQLVYTGNPVREEFFTVDKQISNKPPYTLLVTGGSQGARAINRAMQDLIDHMPKGLAIIHVTGENHYAEYAKYASTHYHPLAFTNYMVDLVKQADLVVSRSGGSVFELAASARPSILIPLSTSANRHQESNAAYFKNHHAAFVIEEVDLTPEHLAETVKNLLDDAAKRTSLSREIHRLSVPNAARNVAKEVLTLADQSRGK